MTDDARCLRKYAELRDESAFSEFVHRNVDFVYSAALRQTGGDVHLAEDIAQKVFFFAAKKAAILGRHPVVGAWLHQTTRYVAIDAMRSRQRRQSRESEAGQMTEPGPAPDAHLEWDKISPELDRMVAALGERDRDAVILRFFGGKSFADIGAKLDLTEGAARMRVERALEKLRGRLSRAGITSSCAAFSALLAENGVMAAPAGLGPAAIATALGAPAAGGLAAVLGTLRIMTTAKITLAVATLAVLASLATAVHEYRHACDAEQALAGAEQALADAVHARGAVPTGVAPANLHPDQLKTQPDGTAQNSAAATTAGPQKSAFSALLALLNNPAMQMQTEILAKMRLDGQYAAFFKNLNLTPGQIDQFKNLMVEKQMVGFDSMSVAHQQGIDGSKDPQAFFQVVAQAEKTVDDQVAALLGADGYSQFQQYQQTIPARNTSNLLSQALSYTSAPLTDAQADGVIKVLTQYGTPPLPPDNPFAVLNGDLGIIKLNDEGLTQIQAILSAPQIQALQGKMQDQLQLLQTRKRMGR
jgi:RNA polymerase sigma factor (sigma-70 family)